MHENKMNNLMDYKNNNDLIENMEEKYNDYKIRIKRINGYIYRGDYHMNNVLSLIPRFYGTKESASKYILKGSYLKRYTTMRELILLNMSNDNENTNKDMIIFFKNMAKQYLEFSLDIKIASILSQICFGLVSKVFDMMELSLKDVSEYLMKNTIEFTEVRMFFELVYSLLKRESVPSRCSIRIFDKLLMKILSKILKPLKIDGIFYVQPRDLSPDGPKKLCEIANKYFKENTCVPTEIVIFDSSNNLGAVEFWKKTNNNLIYIPKKDKYNRHVKANYGKMSINDLYTLSNMYKNNKNET